MTLFSSSNLIIYISKLVSLFTAITVFTIINLSSLQADEQGSFEDWLIYIENLALKEGISKDTINNSIKNITQNERVLELDRSQPEFTLTLEKYLSNTTPASRVKKGKKLYEENKNIPKQITNTDEEIINAYKILAKEGVFCEPASAASVAGLIKNKNRIQKESTIVCVLTGNGLKDPDCAIKNNDAIFRKNVEPSL